MQNLNLIFIFKYLFLMMLLKITLFGVFWCNAMRLCGLRFKKHIIFHILYIIDAPLCPAFIIQIEL